ncbi:hypothetical protein MIMGU_mgv11b018840mg [Erythranthe guttata]|uniref:Protein kinase domain-containing protein n=1 Tax=Erythranthe guttata TaxID=4155 RepID=A0A022QKP7_ERYGU|nr:hypothetical protein MIMGU_mgv11b018840mg [Erythranthe guttata]
MKAQAAVLCRGDVGLDECRRCLRDITAKLLKSCPNQKQAVKIIVDEITALESLQYVFSTIKAATNDFSDNNKLGQGGFGSVYKGKLPNDKEIAVKRLSMNSGQGDVEFKNEVLLLAKLQHRNLVRLLGFAIQGTEKLIVYEFVHNGSLDHFMLDPIKRQCLGWDRRYEIIRGIARGLLYLHEDSELRIIHRDLKLGNVLLDREMNPKIADFGLARLFEQDETQGNTRMVVGTYGYMSPEYIMHGHFSVKSDVFSFGVLVLEITSGQKNSSIKIGDNMEDLLTFAFTNHSKQSLHSDFPKSLVHWPNPYLFPPRPSTSTSPVANIKLSPGAAAASPSNIVLPFAAAAGSPKLELFDRYTVKLDFSQPLLRMTFASSLVNKVFTFSVQAEELLASDDGQQIEPPCSLVSA